MGQALLIEAFIESVSKLGKTYFKSVFKFTSTLNKDCRFGFNRPYFKKTEFITGTGKPAPETNLVNSVFLKELPFNHTTVGEEVDSWHVGSVAVRQP